jgi:hypothetical protein
MIRVVLSALALKGMKPMNRVLPVGWVFAWLLPLACVGLAEDAPDDDLASEFKKGMLIRVNHVSHSASFQCTVYTDAERKRIKERFIAEKAKSGAPTSNLEFHGTYLVLEVKKDRLLLVPEIWSDHRRVRVIPLRYVSEIYRAGLYEEPAK